MAQGAANVDKGSDLSDEEDEAIRGTSAAVEIFGNFFAQNCFPAASGVVLIQGTLAALGYEVTLQSIATAAIPVALIVVVLTIIQVTLLDKKLKRRK